MISMQEIDYGHNAATDDLVSCQDGRFNLLMDVETGLAFAASIAIIDLDPKFPETFAQLEQKLASKDCCRTPEAFNVVSDDDDVVCLPDLNGNNEYYCLKETAAVLQSMFM